MCHCNVHFYVLLGFLLLLLIVGGVTGGRYAIYYKMTCTAYVLCPADTQDSDTYNGRRGHAVSGSTSSQCVQLNDVDGHLKGLQFIGNVGVASPRPELPASCWTNGFDVDFLNPKQVMLWSFGVVGCLAGLYVVVALMYLCYQSARDDQWIPSYFGDDRLSDVVHRRRDNSNDTYKEGEYCSFSCLFFFDCLKSLLHLEQ